MCECGLEPFYPPYAIVVGFFFTRLSELISEIIVCLLIIICCNSAMSCARYVTRCVCYVWLIGCSHSGINSCRYSTPSDPPAPYDNDSPGPSLPSPLPGVVCTEDFCRLGCVCDSIKRSVSPTETRQRDHCGHADCMLECTCTYRTRLRSGRMSLYDRETAPGDDDPFPPDIHAIQPSVVRPQPCQSAAVQAPPRLRRLHRELMRLHVRSEDKALIGDYGADDGGLVRKSGRIREREQLSFSGFEKLKPLFLYDASFMLNDDVSRTRRRKVP